MNRTELALSLARRTFLRPSRVQQPPSLNKSQPRQVTGRHEDGSEQTWKSLAKAADDIGINRQALYRAVKAGQAVNGWTLTTGELTKRTYNERTAT